MKVRLHLLATAFFATLIGCAPSSEPEEATTEDALLEEIVDSLPNNFPIINQHGFSASFSTDGYVDLTSNFFTRQGTNGRHCGTCHLAEDGWSIKPGTVVLMFLLTGGTHPIFNVIDADRPDADIS